MTNQGIDDVREILGDRYQVEQQLGKKAGRRTLLARDLQTQELVVIKLLLFGDEFEWEDLKLFEREAETLRNLSHPAIPQYLDYFDLSSNSSRGFALVQSYIAAQPLDTQLKAGRRFSEDEVKQIATAILEILAYLHAQQPPVIHRDIKPSNILLTNRSGNNVGEVYLVDFGSAQTVAARRSSTMTVVGTYGYMPPEQFSGRAMPSSDIFSLGATLVYLITGQHPADLPQTDLKIEFEPAANISSGFCRWLRKTIEPVASKRFISAESALPALARSHEVVRDEVESYVRPKKPVHSQVDLVKTSDFIEIIIYSVGFLSGKTYLELICLVSFIFVISGFILTQGSYFDLTTIFFLLPALISCMLYVIWVLGKLFAAISEKMHLHIDGQNVFRFYTTFNNKHDVSQVCPRQSISQIILTVNTSNHLCLIISTDTTKYEFPSSEEFPLTAPEVDWLAHELSDWLGLPITRIGLPMRRSTSSL